MHWSWGYSVAIYVHNKRNEVGSIFSLINYIIWHVQYTAASDVLAATRGVALPTMLLLYTTFIFASV